MHFHHCDPSNIFIPQWNHYIQCDGSPDPSVSPEINTFISLWKEETNETLEEVIAKSKLVLNVCPRVLLCNFKLFKLQIVWYRLQNRNKLNKYIFVFAN